MEFYTAQNELCRVSFYFEGWTGDFGDLTPTNRPFVLSEFNQEEDLFKPLRPQLATIEFVSVSGIGLDQFISTNDTDIEVRFTFGSFTNYWIGYILQDNFSETWINSRHVVRLTASEGIGLLQYDEFSDNGTEIVGRLTFYDAIKYCLQPAPLDYNSIRYINNLYHISMDDTGTNIPLDQCYIDARSFQIEARKFEDKKLALEKINTAWSQTLFQYNGNWHIHRIEELYTPYTSNMSMVTDGGTRSQSNVRFDVSVGKTQDVKPIAPEMTRFIKRRTKTDQNQFSFDEFNEVIENESFTRGDIVSQNPNVTLRQLDSWTYHKGTSLASPTTPTGNYGIEEVYNDDGTFNTSYAYFDISTQTEDYWIKSTDAQMFQFQKLDIQVEVSYNPFLGNFPTGKKTTFPLWVFLNGSVNNYQLLGTGKWEAIATMYPTKAVELDYDSDKGPLANDWNTLNVVSDSMPETGTITIYFYAKGQTGMIGNSFRIKNFVLKVLNNWQVDTLRRNITGQRLYYKKTDTLRTDSDYDIYFGDNYSMSHKGTIYENDANTIIGKNWYRKRFASESHGFRKQSLISRWENNRFNRNKIDANLYGLTYSGGTKPIGLVNTVRFIDDDPTKIYAILNLREIDFAASTWNATLLEVFDSSKDVSTNPVYSFNANVVTGTYSSITYVPFTITSSGNVNIAGGNIFEYLGDDTISVNLSCAVGGYVNSATSVPSTVNITLIKNGGTIATYPINLTSPLPNPFNAILDTNPFTLEKFDNFAVQIDSNISSLDISTGSISFTYTSAVPFSYDNYTEEFISN